LAVLFKSLNMQITRLSSQTCLIVSSRSLYTLN
jgi:hypothetical protein